MYAIITIMYNDFIHPVATPQPVVIHDVSKATRKLRRIEDKRLYKQLKPKWFVTSAEKQSGFG